MKDYYDLWTAHRLGIVTVSGLGEALRHTFSRRRTELPAELPEGLTAAFANDASKQAQWAAFVRKSKRNAPPLPELIAAIASLAGPAFDSARRESLQRLS